MYANLVAVAALTASATASWLPVDRPTNISVAGFTNPTLSSSKGGKAFCVEGTVPVTASTDQAVILNTQVPANQSVVTESVLQFISAGSTIAQQVVGATHTVSGTYKINARICYPKSKGYAAGTNVQILTHGIGFDQSYWDVAEGYSYVDALAANGSTTFSYDRLGVGKSEHAEPIQVVQAPVEAAILHSLTQSLRNGVFANTKFQHVVGVGHSFGSILSVAQLSQFPTDLDAVVLTGFSPNSTGTTPFFTGLNAAIASQNDPIRFFGLNNAYLVADNSISNQIAFFKSPGFPPALLGVAERTKQTVTVGELFTQSSAAKPAPGFTGPAIVVNGDSDLPFCFGNCSYPVDKLQEVKTSLLPNANPFQTYQGKLSGHGLNLHYSAPAAYSAIAAFLQTAGFA